MEYPTALVCLYGYAGEQRPGDDWPEYEKYLDNVLIKAQEKNLQLVLCGGQTLGFGSEALSVSQWVKNNRPSKMVFQKQFVLEHKSKNTIENLVYGYQECVDYQLNPPDFVFCDVGRSYKVRLLLRFLKLIRRIKNIPIVIPIPLADSSWKSNILFQTTIGTIKSIIVEYRNLK